VTDLPDLLEGGPLTPDEAVRRAERVRKRSARRQRKQSQIAAAVARLKQLRIELSQIDQESI
jgi:hypothetical protein